MFKNTFVFICFTLFIIGVESQKCKTSEDCSVGMCCSEYFYCGDTEAHCRGSYKKVDGCGNGKQGKCPNPGECCSEYGYCGTGSDYCGVKPGDQKGSFFDPTVLKSCGITATNQDRVASVPGDASACGKYIIVKANGKEVRAQVTDIASGFPANYIELSPGAFDVLAGKEKHVIPLTWQWA